MSRACLNFRRVLSALATLTAMLSTELCEAQTETTPEKKDEGVMIRMLCVQSLTGDEEDAVLATKTEDGKWIERGKVTLRSPFISEWFRVSPGTTHLTRKVGQEIKSFGSFPVPPNVKRLVIILVPDTKNNTYRAQVIDPGNLGFRKGKALVLNYGNVPAMVKIGKNQITVPQGKQIVADIDANEDGMYRLLVGHLDKDRNIVPCYDKFVSSDRRTRKFILLFPDPHSGLRAMTLSEFGPFE